MDKVEFILDTSADIFAHWLLTAWRAPRSYKGYHLQALRDGWSRGPTPVRTLTAAAIYVSPVENERGNQTSYPFGNVLSFQLIPIANERVEVQAEIDLPVLLSYLADLIEDMAHPARWPQLRDTLSWRLDWYAETADGQAALEAFDARMRRLKDTPGQRAPFNEPPAGITGAGGANGQAAGEDLPATAKPDGRKRAMLVRHNKIHKLFEDGLGDLTVTYLAKKCGVNRKTIQRDLKALGLEIPRTDDLPPENVP